MKDNVGTVKFKIEPMLCPWDDPEHCVLQVRGRITVHRDARDENITVGKLRALVVRAGEAENLGFGIATASDAYHQWLADAYGAVFVGGELRPELDIGCVGQDFVYLERLALKRQYRRRGLAAQAIRTLIATFGVGLLIADSDLDVSSADRMSVGFHPAADADHIFLDASRRRPEQQKNDD
jgi:ribosomal protein S18 acetylase RimI-like enzyme